METMNSPNGARRTGATWVAATGAFLLLAAATVFVATSWDHIPDAAKLAALVAATGACVLAGDRLRRALPATGNALFHLGALLVPIDIVALGLRTDMSWQQLLLVDSLIASALLALCAWRVHSSVLAAAASAGVIAFAGGVGAMTDAPAPFVLACIALIACAERRLEKHAFVWASAAALAPIALLSLDHAVTGHGVADELGLLRVWWPWSVATAALSTIVIAFAARQREQPALIVIALAGIVAHGVAVWHGTQVPHLVDVLTAPCAFLLIELAVLASARDPFWSRPARVVGEIAEAIAAVPTLIAIPLAFVYAADGRRATELAIAASIAAVAWIAADSRRQNRGAMFLGAAAAAALFAIAAAYGTPWVLVVAAILLSVATLALRDARAWQVAYFTAGYAVIAAMVDERIALAGAFGAAGAYALAALRAPDSARDQRIAGIALAFCALGIGELVGAASVAPVVATVSWVVGCWALATVSDVIDRRTGDLMRAAAFGVLPFLIGVIPDVALVTALVLTAFAALDALRRRERELAFAAVISAVVAEVAFAAVAGLDVANGGLALCVGATVWLGLAATGRDTMWRDPLAFGAAATVFVGLLGAMTTAETFGPALLVTGALVLGLGLTLDQPLAAYLGGAVATLGIWVTLGAHHVLVSEAYVAPVALELLIAGEIARRVSTRRPSSWVAYGPAIALLAGSALAERIAGGSAWHSVIAGAVGVAAVVVGGSRRALAPLLLGTAALIAVVLREVLDSGAGVPTWSWLAAGGAALLASAVAMERADVSPVEAGRRVVDVLAANFD
jgi:hypothetical protein